jgi:hypothetical protein
VHDFDEQAGPLVQLAMGEDAGLSVEAQVEAADGDGDRV